MTRGRWMLTICFVGSLMVAGALAYKRWPQIFRQPEIPKPTAPVNHAPQDGLSSIPPFSTKEPERYQATRIVTSTEYQDDSGGTPVTTTNTTRIARDGAQRREEYETSANETVVFLETSAGRFILLPDKKLYADLNSASSDAVDFALPGDATEAFSPDRLLNEIRSLARYEKLGAETIGGRTTTKYRVTRDSSGEAANNESSAGGVTLIWIDDALGLPLRSETSAPANNHGARQVVELRDLKQTIDAGIFELPRDYRKVEYRLLFSQMPPPPETPGAEKAKAPSP